MKQLPRWPRSGCAHSASSRRRAWLKTCAVAAGVLSALLSVHVGPAAAQQAKAPLGGPTVSVTDTSVAVRRVSHVNAGRKAGGHKPNASTGAPATATPTAGAMSTPVATVRRIAQSQTTPIPNPDLKEGTGAGSAQGVLPIDLGQVRRLRVAGKVITETPLRVGNLDVLAPIVESLPDLGVSASRAAVGNLPGNPNTPTEDKIFQINLAQGQPIVLTVGKATAYINQVEQSLRAAPLVIGDKIWLPIYSLAPLIGASVRLETDGTLNVNPTIQSVELFPVKNMVALTVKTSAPIAPGKVLMGTLDDPPKLYLDFSGYSMGFDAANSTAERIVSAGLGDVVKVRAGMFQSFPDITRVVLDLKRDMKGVTQPLPDKNLFALILVPPGKSTGGNVGSMAMYQSDNGDPNSLRGLTIVVDAGHGGQDFGARGAQSMEKTHTLDIARRVANGLRGRGANVLMTRDGDYFISLQGRVDFANTRKADVFFSVHINDFKPESNGTETYYYTAPSLMLAREVHKELVKATGLKDRGVLQERFFVIRKTWMPSVLTECAFISNAKEEALLLDPNWRERVARGMVQGIANYVNHYLRGAQTPS